jgi:actin-related protein
MEKGLLSDFTSFEYLTDYIFRTLGCSEFPISGDIIYTEPFANLSQKRESTMRLFFEGYGVNRLCPLPEPLVNLLDHPFKAQVASNNQSNGMVVSVGYRQVFIIPIIGGRPAMEDSRRINVGSFDCFTFMSKSLSLKYEHLAAKLDFPTLKVAALSQLRRSTTSLHSAVRTTRRN